MTRRGMFRVQDTRSFAQAGSGPRSGRSVVSRTVILLGITSVFTDVSSEMVATISPLYPVLTLRVTPSPDGSPRS